MKHTLVLQNGLYSLFRNDQPMICPFQMPVIDNGRPLQAQCCSNCPHFDYQHQISEHHPEEQGVHISCGGVWQILTIDEVISAEEMTRRMNEPKIEVVKPQIILPK